MENRIPMQLGVTQTEYQDDAVKNVHKAIISLDAELAKAVDNSYRQKLVEANYILRDLEERMRRVKKSP